MKMNIISKWLYVFQISFPVLPSVESIENLSLFAFNESILQQKASILTRDIKARSFLSGICWTRHSSFLKTFTCASQSDVVGWSSDFAEFATSTFYTAGYIASSIDRFNSRESKWRRARAPPPILVSFFSPFEASNRRSTLDTWWSYTWYFRAFSLLFCSRCSRQQLLHVSFLLLL